VNVDEAALRDGAGRLAAAVGGRRRVTAAVLAGIAVLAGLRAVSPDQPPTREVWAAARDLTGGRALTAADLRHVALPVSAVPAGALPTAQRLVGRLLAAPMRRGETFTDVRLLEPALLAALGPDLVAVPVHVADGSAAAALVHSGDVVDVLAVDDPGSGVGGEPQTVAAGVTVVSVPARISVSADGGGLVVVAVTRSQAATLARAAVGERLSLALVHP
jgi:Flp pilus assembly protein CpaB